MLAEPVRIGASLPITGGLAINGQKHKAGYELCIELINQAGGLLGEPVEIVISDNQSSNETAQAQFERLINEDDVDVLFGTFSSRLTFPTSSPPFCRTMPERPRQRQEGDRPHAADQVG